MSTQTHTVTLVSHLDQFEHEKCFDVDSQNQSKKWEYHVFSSVTLKWVSLRQNQSHWSYPYKIFDLRNKKKKQDNDGKLSYINFLLNIHQGKLLLLVENPMMQCKTKPPPHPDVISSQETVSVILNMMLLCVIIYFWKQLLCFYLRRRTEHQFWVEQ